MTTPAAVEKEVIDINLMGGVDESTPEECIDWTKRFSVAENVSVNGPSLTTRPGLQEVCSSPESDGLNGPIDTCMRLGAMDAGLVIVDAAGVSNLSSLTAPLAQLTQDTARLIRKGTVPDFGITRKVIGYTDNVTGDGGCVGVANCGDVSAFALRSSGPGETISSILITEGQNVDNIIIRYDLYVSITGMVCVDHQYLHIYCAGGGDVPFMMVVDLENLPADSDSFPAPTALTGGDVDMPIAGIAAWDRAGGLGYSVVCTGGSTTLVESFNNAGVSIGVGSFTGMTTAQGIDVGLGGPTLDFIWVCGHTATPQYQLVLLRNISGTITVARTITDTTAVDVGVEPAGRIRVAANKNVSNDVRLVAYNGVNAFVGSETTSMVSVYSITASNTEFANLGYMSSWLEVSQPYFDIESSGYLVHMCNDLSADFQPVMNSSCVVDITTPTTRLIGTRFAPVAVLDTYTSLSPGLYTQSNFKQAYRPHRLRLGDTGNTILFTYPDSAAFNQIKGRPEFKNHVAAFLRAHDPTTVNFASNSISGSIVCSYDGQQVHEHGFVQVPGVVLTDTEDGSLADGSYNYTVTYQYLDYDGRVHYSRNSIVKNIVTVSGTGNVNLYITIPAVTKRTLDIFINVFRTTSGGTQFHLLKTFKVNNPVLLSMPEVAFVLTTDTTSDPGVEAAPLMYRQPGTAATAQDRYHALQGLQVIRHKDRQFYCNGTRVFYSSFDVENEGSWFNPVFSFNVPGGTGNITGLASMDGVLVIFKKDSVFAVDGDGPPENGGNGTEFSPPRRIHTEFGCMDPRTIVNMPNGIMYRSPRGIELLNRSLQVSFIGERIARTVDDRPLCGGATLDRKGGRYILPIGVYAEENARTGLLLPDSDGVVICYDSINDSWTTQTYIHDSAIGGDPPNADPTSIQDICFLGATDTVYAAYADQLKAENPAKGYDQYGNRAMVQWNLQTGWVRAPSKQDRIKVTDIMFLGRFHSAHDIQCSFMYDYKSSPTTVIHRFTSSELSTGVMDPEQLTWQPSREGVQAMKFIIKTLPPAEEELTPGGKLDLFGLTVRVGYKGGGAKLAVANKG